MLLALLITTPQTKIVPRHEIPKVAKKPQQPQGNGANRFILFVRGAKTLSVHMSLHRPDRPTDGQADLILARPAKLSYHLTWGPEDYTYTIYNGQGMEVDRGIKLYDEYPVPGWQPPEANGSPWVDSCFPVPFVDESLLVPSSSVDADGHLSAFAFTAGDPPVKTIVKFSDYKTDFPVSDAQFMLKPPVGFSAYSVDTPVPPRAIGQTLPSATLVDEGGRSSSLDQLLAGKPTLIAVLDPESQPSLNSISVVKTVKNVKVIVVSTGASSKGISAGSLPVFYDPKAGLANAWKIGATPMFYLVDGKGKITNVWYGFDKDKSGRFATQISDAVSDLSSSE